jgi:hypothetical protein
MTIKDLHEYIEQHPAREIVFKGWSTTAVAVALFEAYKSHSLRWCTSERGILCGVVIGKPDFDTQTMHIVGIICDNKNVLAQFLREFLQAYGMPWKITGFRKGKVKTFSIKKLAQVATKNCL